MKQNYRFLAVPVLAMVASCAFATDWLPATRGELKSEATVRAAADVAETKARIAGDAGLQSQINQQGQYTTSVKNSLESAIATQSGINAAQNAHTTAVQEAAQAANEKGDYAHVRLDAAEGAIRETNGAVESVNADLQSSKAAVAGAISAQAGVNSAVQGQIGAVDGKVNALAEAGTSAVGNIQGQIDQSRADGAAAIGQTNTAVKAVDDKVNVAIGAQTGINGQVQSQISDVNGKAVNAQVTADYAVGQGQKNANDIINTNNTLTSTVGQVQKNTNDIVNTTKVAQDAFNNAATAQQGVNANSASLASTNGVVAAQGAQISNNTTNIAKNTSDIKATNVVVGQNTKDIGTLGARADQTDLEVAGVKQVNTRQDIQIGNNTSAINAQAQRWDSQDGINAALDIRLGGAYQRLDSQQAQIDRNKRDIKTSKNMAVAALAVANLQFCTQLECGFQAAASIANMEGSNAFALGAGGAISERVFVNGSFTSSGSVTGVSAGMT